VPGGCSTLCVIFTVHHMTPLHSCAWSHVDDEAKLNKSHCLYVQVCSQNSSSSNISFIMSVHMSVWRNLASTGKIFKTFDTEDFYKNLCLKIQILLKSDKNTGHFKWRSTLLYGKYQYYIIMSAFVIDASMVSAVTVAAVVTGNVLFTRG
jgi:hypothetical protein